MSEENNSVSAASDNSDILTQALELIKSGKHQEAAELIIGNHLADLPSDHPAKGGFGVIEGEEVSKLYQFEEYGDKVKDSARFLSIMTSLNTLEGQSRLYYAVLFFFTLHRPDLQSLFTRYLEKTEENHQKGLRGEVIGPWDLSSLPPAR